MANLLCKLARNYSSVMDKILQAFSDIADVLPRLDRLKATFPDDTNFNHVVGLIYSDIIEFHRRAYKIFRRKAWHVWFTFDWGLFERRFKLILQKLALHCDLLDKEAAAAHFSEMKQDRDKRQLEVDAYEQERQNKMAQDVFRWLSAEEDQQEDQLCRISDKRQLETCDWVLKDPQMKSWIEDDCGDAILWMTGIPGAGKSFLCSLLIQNLQTRRNLSTLYYFCGHQSSSANTCAIILRTLAYQVLQHNPDMVPLIHQAYLQKGSNRSGSAMKRLLKQVLPTSKVSRIVIDGIDEDDHVAQQEILKNLIEIRKSADHCCKLLVSSRDEPQIQKPLATKNHLRLGEKTVDGLNLFIKDRIKDLQASFSWMDAALVSLAEQRLRFKAKGMFLWVRLVTDMLIDQASELEFRNAIDQLPEGLDEAYGRIRSRIDSMRPVQLRQRAFSILYWVCAARRPVSLHEVADGIALHLGQTVLDRRTRSNNPSKDIIEICAPLLERLKNDVLDVVHFSAKEYFIHEQSGPFIDIAKANLTIAFSCVINLTSCLDFVRRGNDGMSESDLESRVVQGSYGLHSYAQEFWAEHVLAYLGQVGDQDADARELIGALEAFSQVWKHRAHADISLPVKLHTSEASFGLNNLRTFPILHRFISGWIHFKSEFTKTRSSLNTLAAQEQWRLAADETFLSLIDSRLCIITERLLMMQSCQLPSHIDKDDFKNFVGRSSFLCRFQGCNHHYGTIQERDTHESSHTLSFPCLQCDFSGRGFRSRKDLEKHTQKYHMSPEDFQIPDDLHTIGGYARGYSSLNSGSSRASYTQSGRWTELGRKALQQGFHHVLARLKSEIDVVTGNAGGLGSDTASAMAVGPRLDQHTNGTMMMTKIDSIRHNVREQKYDSLADFKSDLRILSRDLATASAIVGDRQIESICDDELEKAMSAFPAFANFDHTAFKRGTTAILTSNSSEQLQGHMEGLSEQKDDTATSNAISSGTRVPYWSRPEEEQFPELLQRYGRDFARIADHLKTKTPEDVGQHFFYLLTNGNTKFSDLAALADARLQREARSIETTTDSRDAKFEIQAPDDPAHGNSHHLFHPISTSTAGTPFPHFEIPKKSLASVQGATKNAETNLEPGEKMEGPVRKKRRPPPRVLCPDCPDHKNGFRDEYALKKHTARFHRATRKVWICEDISIDKRFLTKCKSCSASKRYSSGNNAGKHLRQEHFNAETSPETLQRWMREAEEPNPNMKMLSADSASTTRRIRKTQSTRGRAISLPPLKHHLDSPRTLPSTIFETDGQKPLSSMSRSRSSSSLDDSVDEVEETDARDISLSSPEAKSSNKEVFLEDISFDNLLSGNPSEPRLLSDEGSPHLINRALIKPDQVLRLPNLDPFRKAACLDQVEALYHRLDNALMGSLPHKKAMEDLTSLSRLLMRNLRDWRRHSTLAPHIPFSI